MDAMAVQVPALPCFPHPQQARILHNSFSPDGRARALAAAIEASSTLYGSTPAP